MAKTNQSGQPYPGPQLAGRTAAPYGTLIGKALARGDTWSTPPGQVIDSEDYVDLQRRRAGSKLPFRPYSPRLKRG